MPGLAITESHRTWQLPKVDPRFFTGGPGLRGCGTACHTKFPSPTSSPVPFPTIFGFGRAMISVLICVTNCLNRKMVFLVPHTRVKKKILGSSVQYLSTRHGNHHIYPLCTRDRQWQHEPGTWSPLSEMMLGRLLRWHTAQTCSSARQSRFLSRRARRCQQLDCQSLLWQFVAPSPCSACHGKTTLRCCFHRPRVPWQSLSRPLRQANGPFRPRYCTVCACRRCFGESVDTAAKGRGF